MENIITWKELKNNIRKIITVSGIASDSKTGAVIKLIGGIIYIQGYDSWGALFENQEVIATGKLNKKKIMADPITSSNGLISQGKFGENFILENPKCRLVKDLDWY